MTDTARPLAGIASDAARVLVRGVANAGKTGLALAHVAALVERGADPSSILFVAASPTAAADARAALEARGAWGARVRATTAMEFELELLADPAARRLTGRRARVLTEFEHAMVMEDMRAEAIPTKNLKGMLGFFQRGLTELADDDMDAFIIDPRENMALTAWQGYLTAYEAMHPCEVANLAVRCLRAGCAPSPCGVEHVVVDDYQCLNRASQVALELLGPATLWVFADPHDAPRGTDPFPYLAGINEFAQRNDGATVVDLPAPDGHGAPAAAAYLVDAGYTEALSLGMLESRGPQAVPESYDVAVSPVAYEGVRALVKATPAEELDAVAARVRDLLEEGCRPSQILVCTPNATWQKGVCTALGRQGVTAQTLGVRQPVGGDLRRLEACGSGRMYAALGLLADASDPLSWRVWVGCGDYVGRSPVFKQLVPAAREQGVTVDRALGLLAADGAGQGRAKPAIAEVYDQGRQMLEALAGLGGEALVGELAGGLGLEAVPPVFARACALCAPEAGAAELFAAVQRLVFFAGLAGDEAGVRVVDYACLAGMKAQHVLAAGCMNGWLPRHAYFDTAEAYFPERQRMDREGRHTVYALAGAATGDVCFSGFSSCDLETAERLKLKGYRVSMGANGARVTSCKPSLFLDYAFDAWGLGDVQ